MARPPATLYSSRTGLLGTERAFKLVSRIREVEEDGRPVVRVNLGQPDFALPAHIRRAVQEALDAGHTGYCDAQGLPELRRTIAREMGGARGLDVDPDRVVVYPGARAPIGFAQQTYVEPGDEVVYPSPGYPLFESFIPYVGARPVPLRLERESGFAVRPSDLEAVLGPRTKLVFLNSPSNPTGGVLEEEDLAGIAEVILAGARPDVRIYSDETYEAILFDGARHRSIASLPHMEERTILVSGVSKTYSWTGGRVGWAIYPTVEEAAVHRNLNINYFASISPYNQIGAKVALESPESPPAVQAMVDAFQERRDVVVAELEALPGVRCLEPRGAFYLFPDIGGLLEGLGAMEAFDALESGVRETTSPSTLFALFLLYRYRVAAMDRRSFGVLGSEGQHFLRISIATDLADLRLAVARIAEAAEDAEGFRAFVREGRRLTL
jgi:aspartate aminotransferase